MTVRNLDKHRFSTAKPKQQLILICKEYHSCSQEASRTPNPKEPSRSTAPAAPAAPATEPLLANRQGWEAGNPQRGPEAPRVLDIHEAVPEPCWAKAVPVQRHSSQEVVEELARPGEAAEDPRVSSHSSGLPAKHGAVVARELSGRGR